MNKRLKRVLVILMSMSMVVAVAGCGNTSSDNNSESSNNSSTDSAQVLSGFINAGGSTSVEKAAIKALEEFNALNPDVSYGYDATGSSTGIKNAKDGTYDLGFASRELKEDEKEGITYMPIAMDGIAVAINPENSVTGITMKELKGIYTGEITNWNELGGKDAEIVVVSRENGSGTRSAFEELSEVEENLVTNATIKSGNGEVAAYVANEQNSIGYVSFVTLDANKEKISGLKIGDINPTVENVQSGDYKLARPFNIIYNEQTINETEKAFIEFLMTGEGQDLLEEAGAIRIK